MTARSLKRRSTNVCAGIKAVSVNAKTEFDAAAENICCIAWLKAGKLVHSQRNGRVLSARQQSRYFEAVMEGQAVVDARRKAQLKQAANRLSDLFIDDVNKYVAECETYYSGGKYTDAEYAYAMYISR